MPDAQEYEGHRLAEIVRHSLHVLADARKHAVSSHERHATEGFDALIALEAALSTANEKVRELTEATRRLGLRICGAGACPKDGYCECYGDEECPIAAAREAKES